MEENELVIPVIHLNGTGKALLEEFEAASDAFDEFVEKFKEVTCHGRDYYVISDDAFSKAREARCVIERHIKEIGSYLEAHLIALNDQL